MKKRKVLINKHQTKWDMRMKNIMQGDMRWALKKLMNSLISKLYWTKLLGQVGHIPLKGKKYHQNQVKDQ